MSIDEVLSQACEEIDGLGIEQDPQSRVSSYPDVRSFRMYRTKKLVDAPNAKSGTAGVYGPKHVLQLVAIKSLQARRLPLREIRKTLAHASENELKKLVGHVNLARSAPPKAKRSHSRPPKKDNRWIHIQLAEGVFVMVDDELLSSSRPSSLRALGERFTSSLLSHRS